MTQTLAREESLMPKSKGDPILPQWVAFSDLIQAYRWKSRTWALNSSPSPATSQTPTTARTCRGTALTPEFKEERMLPGDKMKRPPGITRADTLSYEMKPGDVLWNALLTPHWVEAADCVTYSINISHGGLRLNGKLCLHEQELEAWKA